MGFCLSLHRCLERKVAVINPSKLWKEKLKKREMREMIKTVLEEAPWAGTICMSINNAKRLGMPEKLFGCEVIVKDEGFPDSLFLAGGD